MFSIDAPGTAKNPASTMSASLSATNAFRLISVPPGNATGTVAVVNPAGLAITGATSNSMPGPLVSSPIVTAPAACQSLMISESLSPPNGTVTSSPRLITHSISFRPGASVTNVPPGSNRAADCSIVTDSLPASVPYTTIVSVAVPAGGTGPPVVPPHGT